MHYNCVVNCENPTKILRSVLFRQEKYAPKFGNILFLPEKHTPRFRNKFSSGKSTLRNLGMVISNEKSTFPNCGMCFSFGKSTLRNFGMYFSCWKIRSEIREWTFRLEKYFPEFFSQDFYILLTLSQKLRPSLHQERA